ncbi:MAG: SEC-C metal-binding domain-containing protein [Planctomycetia bacterium]|nr:SEC-C metal-binding domain-containing protein [Planctomycetia bacterium]
MGAIAEAIVNYARPLFDATDGSIDAMNRAMALAQVCWNLAILPEDGRDAAIDEMKRSLEMTDEEFAEFRQHLILPMIERHHEMFPKLHMRSKPTDNAVSVVPSPTKDRPGTGRNAPCPCGSGRKYKRCCGAPGASGSAGV